jgi:molecular chaperone DnaK
MVYNVEKMLKEHRSKIGEADAKNVEDALEATKKAIAGGSLDEINSATDRLTQASHKLAEAMYRTAGTEAGGQPGGGAPGGDGSTRPEEKPQDNVVDAEFVDVDDQKK